MGTRPTITFISDLASLALDHLRFSMDVVKRLRWADSLITVLVLFGISRIKKYIDAARVSSSAVLLVLHPLDTYFQR